MSAEAPKRLSGLFVPNLTPVRGDGEIDEDTLRRYVDWLIERGVHGLYPNGSTGEFTRFTAGERRRIIEIVADQVDGRVAILAGAAEANVRETIDACNYYADLGVDAVAIVAPFYFRVGPDSVYEYFKQIADESRVDVTLYNIPMFASPIDVETVKRLALDCPRIVGIKDSTGDLPGMMRLISTVRPIRPDFSFLTGWDASLAAMLLVGADGGTNATTGVLPELTGAIYAAVRCGDIDEALRWQYRLLPIFDAMVSAAEFPEGFRRAAAIRGWDFGFSRQPIGRAARYRADELQQLLLPMIDEVLLDLKARQEED